MFSTSHMHHVQRGILNSLAKTSPLRFSQLQPRGVPNNSFSYHLKKLVETGYVASTDKGYTITRKALKSLSYTDSGEKRRPRPMTLTMLFITNEQDDVLLLRRRNQPFQHWLGVPSGIIHQGETIDHAAYRELYEKTSIIAKAGSLQSCGVLDLCYEEENSNDTFLHSIGFIYRYSYQGDPQAILGVESSFGELIWSDLDRPDILPEVHDIAEMASCSQISIRSVDFTEPTLREVDK